MTRRDVVAALIALVLALTWIQGADTAVDLDGSLEAKLGLPMVRRRGG